jgi:hypothetical protein
MIARLLRIELRRNTMWMLLPLLAALLWAASPYGRGLKAPVVLWSSRSLAMQGTLQVLGPFAAGFAAWMASRETRRNLIDLLATTARSRWARQRTVLVASAAWGLVFYVVAGAILFALTARQATWGGPVWWPVAVGAVGVLAFTAFGFAAGMLLPGRFTAPMLAIGLLLGLQLSLALHFNHFSWISPAADSVSTDASVFYGVDPGLAVTQLLFMSGVVAAVLGIAVLGPAGTGRWTRAVAGTGREPAPGRAILSLHDGASNQAIPYTPVCASREPIPVCVHPAYRSILQSIAADLAPLTSEVAGLPGAPVRVMMSALQPAATITGTPPVLYLGQVVNTVGPMPASAIGAEARGQVAGAITGAPWNVSRTSLSPAQSAQFAIALGMVQATGLPVISREPPPSILSAAQRFAALPAAQRRAWLATHLLTLRAGHITLAELP